MRRTNFSGNVLLVWLFNLLLNLQWSVPAWILLVMHFWLGWPLWLFWTALAIWVLLTMFFTWFVCWSNKCSNMPDPPKKNKNPYSAKTEDIFPTEESLAKKRGGK